ncbi:MAG TPA: bifunctional o-acetylhomoserine/o-acetylserine sulfhydrylase [Actinomycetales bacterium]|nr:bifunctional o-acetylhomoserine/o-acetylserine sulfhydrylase [Actinomycetales bacterium]
MTNTNWAFETQQIHAGQTPDSATRARALPIYQTTSFVFDDTDHAAARFSLQDLGPIYTRLNNPTTEVVEDRVAALEGGVGALLVSSGQAATTYAILNVAEAGDHVVVSSSLYGGSHNLFNHSLPKLGLKVTFVDNPSDIEAWRAAVTPETKAFFGETIGNPAGDVLDIEPIANLAHEVGVPLIVDNTIATPYALRPIEFGADVVVHSATKYLGGHGNSIGGVIVDSGKFDYGKYPDRFPGFNQPDDSYHGLTYATDLGADGLLGANVSFILKARLQLLRDLGSAISPFNSFLIAQGLETLSLRVERHLENTHKVVDFLNSRPEVNSVTWASQPDSDQYAKAQKYTPKGAGAVISFEIEGGIEAGKAFVDALELHSLVANIGDVRSLVIHPASTTHSQLTPEDQLSTGVTPGLVRLAVGIENIDDIIADLETGFAATRS